MPLFSSKKEKTALLIDIGNGSVTGAFAVFAKNAPPQFLYSLEVPFIVSEKPNASKLADDMLALLSTLLASMAKDGWKHPYWEKNPRKIDGALLAFSSPWFFSKTKHLSLEKEKEFVITRRFIDDIARSEEAAFASELENGRDFEIVEKSIVHAKINGYTLDEAIGKKTRNFDAYLYMSVVSRGIMRKAEELIARSLHIGEGNIVAHTFPLASFSVFRDIFAAGGDFLIFDVTAEVTDITLVLGDVIRQSVSIPSGKNFLIRQIMKTFGVASEIAEEKAGEEDARKMEEILMNVEREWSIYLENGLSELSSAISLPGTIYLTADDDVSRAYIGFLKLAKTDSTALWRKSLDIRHVNKEETSKYYIEGPLAKANEFVGILAMFYRKLFF
jgi:hypothetical protein